MNIRLEYLPIIQIAYQHSSSAHKNHCQKNCMEHKKSFALFFLLLIFGIILNPQQQTIGRYLKYFTQLQAGFYIWR